MKKIVVAGKTIEDAVRNGLTQWKTTGDRVKVQVLEQPSKGLFGLIGSREAKVELEWIPDPIEEAMAFLKDVFRTMLLDADLDTLDTPDGIKLNIYGSELGILIGRRGQTLDSLQYLVNIVANRYSTSHVRIVLDAESFRERRKQTLEELSDRLAKRVMRTRKEVVLEPMSPQERKVIHSQLQNHPNVKTYSKGDDPNRRVVIALR
ncbi:RNA-binding cell elongation regulator Jag/EloR [Paenibacillus koleovorans]|uniref:RNA-binding cell elongation regulator Jag/EloR n=1 Tax=Paenibacillus koleovorans TaxID=121608 RepID=UPI000FDCD9E6|nr:RNA-binding cell elongation regulator Jag/EloR [Paenibacillus koleovorans]